MEQNGKVFCLSCKVTKNWVTAVLRSPHDMYSFHGFVFLPERDLLLQEGICSQRICLIRSFFFFFFFLNLVSFIFLCPLQRRSSKDPGSLWGGSTLYTYKHSIIVKNFKYHLSHFMPFSLYKQDSSFIRKTKEKKNNRNKKKKICISPFWPGTKDMILI